MGQLMTWRYLCDLCVFAVPLCVSDTRTDRSEVYRFLKMGLPRESRTYCTFLYPARSVRRMTLFDAVRGRDVDDTTS